VSRKIWIYATFVRRNVATPLKRLSDNEENKGKEDSEPCDNFKSLRFETSLQVIVISM